MTVELFTSSTTWICPVGVTSVDVECRGGGGGGAKYSRGGGGGGGAYALRRAITVVPGQSYDIIVGSGGSGSANPGGDGNNSYFGDGSNVIAVGGKGGNESNGGAGGLALNCIGDNKYSGGTGSNGVFGSPQRGGGGGGGAGDANKGGDGGTGSNYYRGGSGGVSGGGSGGNGTTDDGGSGVSYSGGGAGARGTSNNGGGGAGGCVQLTYVAAPSTIITSLDTDGRSIVITDNEGGVISQLDSATATIIRSIASPCDYLNGLSLDGKCMYIPAIDSGVNLLSQISL